LGGQILILYCLYINALKLNGRYVSGLIFFYKKNEKKMFLKDPEYIQKVNNRSALSRKNRNEFIP